MISVVFLVLICSKETKMEMNTQKKLHTIVCIVLLSFVPTIIIHHFIFLYHSKFRSQGVFRISRDVDDRMGAKIKISKLHCTKNYPPKKSYTELLTNNIIQLKSSQLRKYLPNVSYPKRIPELKILNPKNSFIIAIT